MENIRNINLQNLDEDTIDNDDIQSEIERIQQLMDEVELFDEKINP